VDEQTAPCAAIEKTRIASHERAGASTALACGFDFALHVVAAVLNDPLGNPIPAIETAKWKTYFELEAAAGDRKYGEDRDRIKSLEKELEHPKKTPANGKR